MAHRLCTGRGPLHTRCSVTEMWPTSGCYMWFKNYQMWATIVFKGPNCHKWTIFRFRLTGGILHVPFAAPLFSTHTSKPHGDEKTTAWQHGMTMIVQMMRENQSDHPCFWPYKNITPPKNRPGFNCRREYKGYSCLTFRVLRQSKSSCLTIRCDTRRLKKQHFFQDPPPHSL